MARIDYYVKTATSANSLIGQNEAEPKSSTPSLGDALGLGTQPGPVPVVEFALEVSIRARPGVHHAKINPDHKCGCQ